MRIDRSILAYTPRQGVHDGRWVGAYISNKRISSTVHHLRVDVWHQMKYMENCIMGTTKLVES